MSRRPHVILINPDQWRGDWLGHLGTPGVQTPVLDRLVADEAISIATAHCQYPICTPSRCSFMTGWYPHSFGHREQLFMLQHDDSTLLWNLRNAGWRVGWFGKNDLIPGERGFAGVADVKHKTTPFGYRLYDQTQERRGQPGGPMYYSFYAGRLEDRPGAVVGEDHDWQMVRAAIRMIDEHDPAQPLCLYLPLHYPHPPYGVEDPWYSAIDPDALPARVPTPASWDGMPGILAETFRLAGVAMDDGTWRDLRRTYAAMMLRVDHQVGLIRDALQRKGMWDDSLLAFFADHGDFAGDYGLVQKDTASLSPCIMRVPFIVRPPRGAACRPGVRRQALAELTDLTATVYDYCGVTPRWMGHGQSLRACLAGAEQHRQEIFCEGGRGRPFAHASSAKDPRNLYWPSEAVAAADHTGMGKSASIRTADWTYIKRQRETDALYDDRTDPHHLRNRISDPACAGVLADLRQRMLDWYHTTADIVPPIVNKRE
jgi:arylsulfatase A-like enzyme